MFRTYKERLTGTPLKKSILGLLFVGVFTMMFWNIKSTSHLKLAGLRGKTSYDEMEKYVAIATGKSHSSRHNKDVSSINAGNFIKDEHIDTESFTKDEKTNTIGFIKDRNIDIRGFIKDSKIDADNIIKDVTIATWKSPSSGDSKHISNNDESINAESFMKDTHTETFITDENINKDYFKTDANINTKSFLKDENIDKGNFVKDEKIDNENSVKHETPETHNELVDLDKLIKKRVSKLRDACDNSSLWRNEIYKHYNFRYMHSDTYKFATCKVPKSGSTFWVQAHAIVEEGSLRARSFITMERNRIHDVSDAWAVGFRHLQYDQRYSNFSVIVTSRNPYTRLFSAYIDKMYLPLMFAASRKLVSRTTRTPSRSTCTRTPTFQDFLKNVLTDAMNGVKLNRHWSPIHSLCNPCAIRTTFLVKQETFSRDAEYVLKSLGVSGEELEMLTDTLHDHRFKITVLNIVKAFCSVVNNSRGILKCLGWNGALRRLWTSLQIQGYIRNTTSCPSQLCAPTTNYVGSTFVAKLILREIKADPLSPADRTQQRRAALVAAYRDVSSDTIHKIQQVFQQDFQLFDYSFDPPS